MARVLIIGGGVAGPVTAMALQRAGIQAVVYEAHAPTTDEEVGSCLTVATNGIDALRAIDAHRPVLAAGFPTPTNLLYSSTPHPDNHACRREQGPCSESGFGWLVTLS